MFVKLTSLVPVSTGQLQNQSRAYSSQFWSGSRSSCLLGWLPFSTVGLNAAQSRLPLTDRNHLSWLGAGLALNIVGSFVCLSALLYGHLRHGRAYPG